MAEFKALVQKIENIEHHPNADRIELVNIYGYQSIVQKNTYKKGQLIVYIPEQAVCPEWVLERLNLVGKLAGKQQNRVKATEFRGVLSEGLIFPLEYRKLLTDSTKHHTEYRYVLSRIEGGPGHLVKEGQDVTKLLGLIKYEPTIPTCMEGEVFNAFGMTPKYDIEDFKRYPNVLIDGEEVMMTEKLHGTWCVLGYHPDAPHHIISSKGMSDKGLAFKLNDVNANNLYLKALNNTIDNTNKNVINRAHKFFGYDKPFYIFGEIFGRGVQDLHYGLTKPAFRVFDINVNEKFINADELKGYCLSLNIEFVPILYVGPFSKSKMLEVTDGKETISGKEDNIREGTVITPIHERRDTELGRVKLKSVSTTYITRRGKKITEYN